MFLKAVICVMKIGGEAYFDEENISLSVAKGGNTFSLYQIEIITHLESKNIFIN